MNEKANNNNLSEEKIIKADRILEDLKFKSYH